MSQYEYDGVESIWFDRTKPISGEEGQCPERGQLYEDAEPIDFVPELQDRIAQLEGERGRLAGALRRRGIHQRYIDRILADTGNRIAVEEGDKAPSGAKEKIDEG